MRVDPALLGPTAALLGAMVLGGASLVAAIYTRRTQDRLARVTTEITKRETVYADFVMSASNLQPTRTRAWSRPARSSA